MALLATKCDLHGNDCPVPKDLHVHVTSGKTQSFCAAACQLCPRLGVAEARMFSRFLWYMKHLELCPKYTNTDAKCTCGFDPLKAELEKRSDW